MDPVKAGIIDLHTCIQGEGRYAGIPHILVRVSGCNLRCQFKDNICDTPYSSWFPEAGQYNLEDVEQLYRNNPQIQHTFITGGEPFLDPHHTQQIISIASRYGHFIAAETNGSIMAELDFDFVTISPKLSNSNPVAGSVVPSTDTSDYRVTEKDYLRHNRQRLKIKALRLLISGYDYQLKFVVEKEADLEEIMSLKDTLDVPASKIYLMPEGILPEQLQTKRPWLIEKCISLGVNYSDRLHIIAYGDKREA